MIVDSSYGKSGIRMLQVRRNGDHHSVSEITVAVGFQGAFDDSYVEGDNSDVFPTDTMKNTVYALAARDPVGEPEAFGRRLGQHFLEHSRKLHRVRVEISEHAWRRLRVDGHDAGSAFMRHGSDVRTASVQTDRRGSTFTAGVGDLLILKSSHSVFAAYPRPIYTTLPETTDRLLATSLTATWRYRSSEVEFGVAWETVRQVLLDVFATHDSRSVQHTLYAMGQAVLDRVSDVGSITLVMPNKHHLLFDLATLGLENRNEIFVPTDEPYGVIEATLVRDVTLGDAPSTGAL
ncbi:MAG: factor-independent urate hydroxylase [Vicinamibacterales bacterium]